jgi:hypothetical protein
MFPLYITVRRTRRRTEVNRLEEGSWMQEVSLVKNRFGGLDNQTKHFAILSGGILFIILNESTLILFLN